MIQKIVVTLRPKKKEMNIESADGKSAKVVSINPDEIVDENGNPINLNDTPALRDWLRKKYQGKTVEVKDDAKKVLFAGSGLKDSAKRRGEAQRQMYADLTGLIENGIYAGYESGDAQHPNVENQNIYYSAAKIGDKVFGVRFKIDTFKNVEKGSYKDHKIAEIEIKKSPSLNKDFEVLQQDGNFTVSIPEIKAAFRDKGTTNNLNNQTKPETIERNT